MSAARPDAGDQGVGSAGFVERHGLHTDEQLAAVTEVIAQIRDRDLRTVRVVLVDQHGIPRAKFLSAEAAISAMRNGADFSGAIYSLDTSNGVFPQAFAPGGGFGIPEFSGFPDVVIVPDPCTFRVLPWADRTGWVLCDVYFSNGRPVPLDGRAIMREQLRRLDAAGYGYTAGLEVEYYIVRLVNERIGLDQTGAPPPPPAVDVFEQGYQFLSESRLDGLEDTLRALRDGLSAVGVTPRSMEDEWGPGQMEFTVAPLAGLDAADAMIMFRTAVKAICRRRGLLATFMCWPALPNFFPSGWHLHESLTAAGSGENAFASDTETISSVGRQFVAGLLEHAKPMTIFTTPTVNGYGRFRPYSFAPDRIGWGFENRGVMVRVQGGAGDSGTHVENRLGEPAANPYLYMAANIAAGLAGINRRAEPPPPVTSDPYAEEAEPLPSSLAAAIAALESDTVFRSAFGDAFVDFYLMMKRAENARYESAVAENPPPEGSIVSEWEMREYFEVY
ncbi:MAG TPA: glutamine synthetase family protein [Candidatus Dormibacteraeota bacterium]|nr:glutamine synthetase family protein [Candidatus Dormibacteraeota bacterium]